MKIQSKPGEPISPVAIENELIDMANLLEETTEKMVKWGIRVGKAEVAYKKKRAIAIVESEGSNAEKRDAEATLASIEEFEAYKTAETWYSALRDKSFSIRYQIEALRSLAANVRHQTG